MTTVVVGAGPAGMACSIMLAQAGRQVILLDENSGPGGHLRYDPYHPSTQKQADVEWRNRMVRAIDHPNISVRTSIIVWAAYRNSDGFEVQCSDPDGPTSIQATSMVLAVGTTDRELQAPGATLPGVLTERALRILVAQYGVIPGARCLLVGDDPRRVRNLDELLRRENVQTGFVAPAAVAAITGTDGVTGVRLQDGTEIPTDIVVLALGERPDTQLAGMLEVDRFWNLSVDGWTVAGSDCGGGLFVIGGARTGEATPADLIEDANHVVERITGKAAQHVPGVTTLLSIAGDGERR